MKLAEPEITIDSSFDRSGEVSFRLDNDSYVLFDVLRSKLYSDPVSAVVREIGTNARDAHVEQGIPDKPIEIFLNNHEITFKDYGPGMSPSLITEVYTVYGKSTKRGDNSQVGSFGLGSKTIFSCADQFSVITHHNGTKYEWLAFINETNIGAIRLINESPSKEVGTSIKIPISYEKSQQFKSAIQSCYQYWKVPPKVFGYGAIKSPPVKISGDGWTIYQHDNYTKSVIALCNGIPYSIGHEFSSKYVGTLALIFDNGELDLSSNRESVYLSDRTKKEIKNKLVSVDSHFKQLYQDEVDKCKDIFEANTKVSEYFDTIGYNHYYSPTGETFKFNGQSISFPLRANIYEIEVRRDRLRFSTDQFIHKCKAVGWIKDPNQYDRRRIRKWMEDNGYSTIVFQEEDFYGIKPFDIKSIKLPTSPKGSSGLPRRKGIVHAKEVYFSNTYKFDDKYVDEIVYIKSRKYQDYGYLPVKVYELKNWDRDSKKMGSNWIELDDYLNRELLNKFSKTDLTRFAEVVQLVEEYKELNYLNYKDFSVTRLLAKHKIDDGLHRLLVFAISNKLITTAKHESIFEKLPVLQLFRNKYVSFEQQKILHDYINKELGK